jgi:hypothetical protein
MSWAVVETENEGVHVVPWDDDCGMPVLGHETGQSCGCRPTPKREGPLDEPVWSHHEPTWPGSEDRVQ